VDLRYPPFLPARLRYRLCPHCAGPLANFSDEEGIERVRWDACGWVHYPSNLMGAAVVVTMPDGGVAFLFPPGAGGAALPAGVTEPGEDPSGTAVRECREETGLEVEVVRALGTWLWREHPYGPMMQFFFEARTVGGTLRDGREGRVEVRRPGDFPAIGPERHGSRRCLEAWLARG
jgi:ADP-ribose pyrophosphatase YjhB (NUDIX family)